jgi:prepilin-type processing-associated H-X9-DG protein
MYAVQNDSVLPLSMPADSNRWYPNRVANVPARNSVDACFWANAVNPTIEDLTCRAVGFSAYNYNGYLHALATSRTRLPKQAILLWEGFGTSPKALSSPRLDCGRIAEPCGFFVGSQTIATPPDTTVWAHGRGANFLFVDGHAAWRRLGEVAHRPTDMGKDPYKVYDQTGKVTEFWLDDDGHAPLFKP